MKKLDWVTPVFLSTPGSKEALGKVYDNLVFTGRGVYALQHDGEIKLSGIEATDIWFEESEFLEEPVISEPEFGADMGELLLSRWPDPMNCYGGKS